MGKALSDGKADGASTITTSGLTFRIPWTEPPAIRASGISIFPITWIWSGAPLKFKSGLPKAWISGQLTNWKFFPVNWPSIPAIFPFVSRKVAFPFKVPGPDRRTRESTRMRSSLKPPRRVRSWRRIPRAGRSAPASETTKVPFGTGFSQVPRAARSHCSFPRLERMAWGKRAVTRPLSRKVPEQGGVNSAGRPHSQGKSGRQGQAEFPRGLPIIIEFPAPASPVGVILPTDPQVRPAQAGLQSAPLFFQAREPPGDLQIARPGPNGFPAPLTLESAAGPTLDREAGPGQAIFPVSRSKSCRTEPNVPWEGKAKRAFSVLEAWPDQVSPSDSFTSQEDRSPPSSQVKFSPARFSRSPLCRPAWNLPAQLRPEPLNPDVHRR